MAQTKSNSPGQVVSRPDSDPSRGVMRAVRQTGYGPPDAVLELVADWPVPGLNPDDLLVRNAATSVNPVDCAVRRGYGAVFWLSR